MVIELVDWDDVLAVQVFRALDAYDHIEAEVTRGGGPQNGYGLFADWRAANGWRVFSVVAVVPRALGAVPFAVLGLNNTGQAGVADAALLARSHKHFRRPLAELGLLLRREFPAFCEARGIHRIEARSWAGHPTAAGLLEACGFEREATMAGFGGHGRTSFHQYAWTAPATTTTTTSQETTPTKPEEHSQCA